MHIYLLYIILYILIDFIPYSYIYIYYYIYIYVQTTHASYLSVYIEHVCVHADTHKLYMFD